MANSLAVFIAVVGVATAQPAGLSGTWTSRGGGDVEIVRMATGSGTARGWSGLAEGLRTSRDYRIVITQTGDRIAISFPGGATNMLSVDETPLGSGARVVDRGDWWTKHLSNVRATDEALELASTTFSGWWRNGGPENAKPNVTDFKRHYTLTRGREPDQLLLRVHVADEKGELEYVQTFRREP